MSSTYSGYIPNQRNLARRERQNAHISLVIGKVLPWVAYPVLVLGAIKSFNLSGVWPLTNLTYPVANAVYQRAPLLWEWVPYPNFQTLTSAHQPFEPVISLLTWVSWFLGLVIICKGLEKKSAKLYKSSDERKKNMATHEAVRSALQIQGINTVNVSGSSNSVNATNNVNNYASSDSSDWKLNAGLWLTLTGAAGNLFAEFLAHLFKKLLGG